MNRLPWLYTETLYSYSSVSLQSKYLELRKEIVSRLHVCFCKRFFSFSIGVLQSFLSLISLYLLLLFQFGFRLLQMVPLSGSGLIRISSSPPPPSKHIQTHTHKSGLYGTHNSTQINSITHLTSSLRKTSL